jgi:hypothetical protein
MHSIKQCNTCTVAGEYTEYMNIQCMSNIKVELMFVVLYGCENWLLTLREECGLRVFENRVLRRIFGPKRDEVVKKWKILHKK